MAKDQGSFFCGMRVNLACLGITLVLTFVGARAWADNARAQELYVSALSLENAGHYGQAVAQYQGALGYSPGYFWVYKRLEACYVRLGEQDLAQKAYDSYMKGRAHYLDLMKFEGGDPGETQDVRVVGRHRPIDLDGVYAAYRKGAGEERAKLYAPAIMDFKAALSLDPDYFWAYKRLADCYYYLGKEDWALDSYDRYLKAHPEDDATRAFAESLRTSEAAPVAAPEQPVAEVPAEVATPIALPTTLPTPEAKVFRLAYGVNGFYGSYSMGAWNAALNRAFDDSSGSNTLSGTPVNGGLGLGANIRYFFNDWWSAGGFVDFMTAGGSFTSYDTNSSGSSDATGIYSFPALFFGPQGTFTFYRPSPRLSLDLSLGLGYLVLVGGNMNYTTYAVTPQGTSEEPQTATLTDSGFGTKFALGADFAILPGYTLTGELGYRWAALGALSSNVGGTLMTAEAGTHLDFSGVYLDLGIAGWR